MTGSRTGRFRLVSIVLAATALAAALLAGSPPEHARAATDCSITPPANIVRSTDANQAAAVVNYPAPTTSGSCSTITCSPASGSSYPVGTTMVTCTASTSPPVKASFTIRVDDGQAPTLTVPSNITVPTDPGRPSAAVSFAAPVATDNVGVTTVYCTHQSGDVYPTGTTTVACQAKDLANNSSNKSFTVTVTDTEPPVFETAPDVTALIRPSTDKAQVTYAIPGAHDNSGVPPLRSCTPQSTSEFSLGSTMVTCTATDYLGNSATTTFQVLVFRDPYWCARSHQLLQVAKLKLKALKAEGAPPAKIRKAKQRVREGKSAVAKACADTAPITSRADAVP